MSPQLRLGSSASVALLVATGSAQLAPRPRVITDVASRSLPIPVKGCFCYFMAIEPWYNHRTAVRFVPMHVLS